MKSLPADPDSGLTPLQRAQLHLLQALVTSAEGGARTYATFLDFAATRIAAEAARLIDWSAE